MVHSLQLRPIKKAAVQLYSPLTLPNGPGQQSHDALSPWKAGLWGALGIEMSAVVLRLCCCGIFLVSANWAACIPAGNSRVGLGRCFRKLRRLFSSNAGTSLLEGDRMNSGRAQLPSHTRLVL